MRTWIDYDHTTNQWKIYSSIFIFDSFIASGARTDYPWDLVWYNANSTSPSILKIL